MVALLIYLLAAMAVSFLCSVLEATLLSTPISYITMREDEGYKPASRMMKFKQDSSRPLAAILSLNTIANTIGAAGVGRQATEVFGSQWFGLVSAIMTILILVFSEIIPKTIGTNNFKSLMGFASSAIRVLITILFPLVVVVEWLQKLISPKTADSSVSREEVGAMADVAEESGELDEDENEIIQNLINIDDITAAQAMTPRVVSAIAPESMTIKSFYKDKRFLHHSRIPVYAGNDEYITGYILRVEALQLMAEDKYDMTLGQIKRDVASFQEDTPIGQVWDEMLRNKEQISVIINEYGAFEGILTMEDVIETILGDEIVDERDVVVDMQQFAKDRWKKQNSTRKGAMLLAALLCLGAPSLSAQETPIGVVMPLPAPTTVMVKPAREAVNHPFVLGMAGYAPGSGEITYGAMVGAVKKVGGYAKFRSSFNDQDPDYILKGDSSIVWMANESATSRMLFTAGLMVRACDFIYPYVGAGYGFRKAYGKVWSDGAGAEQWAQLSDHTYSGAAIDAGVMFRLGPVALSVGADCTAFKYTDVEVGIGIAF